MTAKKTIVWLPIAAIMAAVAIWGQLHALGAWRNSDDFDLRRPMIVSACVAGFLGLWGLALLARSRRLARAAHANKGAGEDTSWQAPS